MSTPDGKFLFPVYVVYSSKTIEELKEFFKTYGKGGRLGMMHLQRAGKYQTNKTICIFDKTVADSLIRAGFSNERAGNIDFAFSPYYFHDTNFPKEDEKSHELYVALPEALTIEKCRSQLEARLAHFVKFDILPKDSYCVEIPFEDRNTGKHKKKATIKFNDEVSREAVAITRILLKDDGWKDDEGKQSGYIICLWSRDFKRHTGTTEGDVERTSPDDAVREEKVEETSSTVPKKEKRRSNFVDKGRANGKSGYRPKVRSFDRPAVRPFQHDPILASVKGAAESVTLPPILPPVSVSVDTSSQPSLILPVTK